MANSIEDQKCEYCGGSGWFERPEAPDHPFLPMGYCYCEMGQWREFESALEPKLPEKSVDPLVELL